MELWKRTVYVCTIGAFLASIGLSQAAPLIPLYLHDLGVHDSGTLAQWSGLAMGITYLVVALVAPFWGRLSDKKGRKLAMMRASVGMTITNTMMVFAQSPEQVLLIRLMNGLVSGFYSASITLVATETPKEKTGWALGVLATANLAGSLVGPMIGGYLGDTFGLRYAFLITASMLTISATTTYFFVKEDFTPPTQKEKLSFTALLEKLEHREALILIGIASFIYAMTIMSLQPILSIYIKDMLPANTEQVALIAGIVFSVLGFAQMLSSTYFGNLIDRWGAHKVVSLSFLFVGVLTIPQAYVHNVYELGALRFFLGLGLGGLLPALNTYVSNHAPKEYSGQVFAYNVSTQFTGYFTGAVGGALIAAHLGFDQLFWLTGLLLIGSGYVLWRKLPA